MSNSNGRLEGLTYHKKLIHEYMMKHVARAPDASSKIKILDAALIQDNALSALFSDSKGMLQNERDKIAGVTATAAPVTTMAPASSSTQGQTQEETIDAINKKSSRVKLTIPAKKPDNKQ